MLLDRIFAKIAPFARSVAEQYLERGSSLLLMVFVEILDSFLFFSCLHE